MKKRRWPWVVLGIVVQVGIAGVVFWERSGFGPGNRIADIEYKNLKAAGWPLDSTDFPAKPPVDPELLEGFKKLGEEAKKVNDPKGAKESPRTWFRRRQRDLNRDFTPLFRLNPKDPITGMGEYSDLRQIMKALTAAAVESAREGDRSGMNRSMKEAVRLSGSMDSNHLLISTLVKLALEAIVRKSALDCLALRPSWVVDFASLENPVTQTNMRKAVQWEANFGLGTTREFRVGSIGDYRTLVNEERFEEVNFSPDSNPYRAGTGLPPDPFARGAAGHLLRGYRQTAELLTPEGMLISRSTFEADRQRLSKGGPSARALARMFIPSLTAAVDAADTRLAAREAFKVVRRAVSFRNQRGRWPSDKELGKLPEDPFAPGTELQYMVQGDNIAVWTVGAKGTSDPMVPSQPADVTWFPKNPTQTAPSP